MAHAHSEVVINHNPACSAARKLLGMIREAGEEPRVVEYLKTPPSRAELLDAIQAHPILMERPVVVGPRGVRLCRPAERVQEALPAR
jgi:arsenate reductase